MAFDRAFASLAANDRDLACDESVSGGFPFRLDLDCGNLAFNDRRANAAVTAARVTATAPLYRPGRVDAVIAGPVTIEAPDQRISLNASWQDAVATVDAGFGGINGATVTLDQVEIVPGAGKNRMPYTHASADRPRRSRRIRPVAATSVHDRCNRPRTPAEEGGRTCRRWRSTPMSPRSISGVRSAPIPAAP